MVPTGWIVSSVRRKAASHAGFIHSARHANSLRKFTKIRSSDVTVLVTGESRHRQRVGRAGNSRAVLASFAECSCRLLHCGPKELSEGYLFGYRRGAFTGAVTDSAGRHRTAAGGTLFLDELCDPALDSSAKLLLSTGRRRFNRSGQRSLKVDVRIIGRY